MRSQRSDLFLLCLAMVPIAVFAWGWITWQQAGEPSLVTPSGYLPPFPYLDHVVALGWAIEQWTPPLVGQQLGMPGLIMVIILAGIAFLVLIFLLVDLAGRGRRAWHHLSQPASASYVVSGIFHQHTEPAIHTTAPPEELEEELI